VAGGGFAGEAGVFVAVALSSMTEKGWPLGAGVAEDACDRWESPPSSAALTSDTVLGTANPCHEWTQVPACNRRATAASDINYMKSTC
jgi:hypothetical protein